MGRISLYMAVGIMVLAVVGVLWAQVDVELRTDVKSATVGDWIPLTLSATVPRGSEIEWPVLEEEVGSLVVLEAREGEVIAKGDFDYQEFHSTVAAYDTGRVVIPGLPVTVIAPGDSIGMEYYTADRTVYISSVLPDSGYPEMVDIRSQVDVPISAWEIIRTATILVLIAGAGYGIYRWILWRKRRRGELPVPAAPVIPPHVLAYRELMELSEQKLWQDGKLAEYYFRLSEIVRRYLEGRYGFPALEMATWDIRQVLPDYVSKEELARKIEGWMEAGDMVKFAKDVPGWEACEQALDFAYRIVDETKEVAVPIEQGVLQEAEA